MEQHHTVCSKENKDWKATNRCGEVMERNWLHNHLSRETTVVSIVTMKAL